MSTPSWATDSPAVPVPISSSATPGATTATTGALDADGGNRVKKTAVGMVFLIVNLGLCVLMAYTGNIVYLNNYL
jgi:hypothetical protein